MYYQRLPFRVMKAYDITVEGYPYAGQAVGDGQRRRPAESPPAGLYGAVAPDAGRPGGRRVPAPSSSRAAWARPAWPSTKLPPGKYGSSPRPSCADGKVLAGSAEAEFEQFARPSWWRRTAGMDHSVPGPVDAGASATRQAIKVLGREYRLGDGSLPRQIIRASGEEMLAGPVTFPLTIGGQTVDLAAPARR